MKLTGEVQSVKIGDCDVQFCHDEKKCPVKILCLAWLSAKQVDKLIQVLCENRSARRRAAIAERDKEGRKP